MAQSAYDAFSHSTKALGMLIAGEAGPITPTVGESPPSGEGSAISGWVHPMPSAGVGVVFGGAKQNQLVKACFDEFIIFSRMPEE
eukprot:CAMPEP_0180232786 /NCGR_PEP_ID=MMETSP0987-20121128/27679_1 /TAXON_ID=697907 /ORGANISM="non described non described, Strain CCMP2293" /LENGTH=84 /DNA_ID=CAMNT_0022198463 /DNA_START=117 /DNA_END=368 /DNA_ORIENTATION=+